MKMVTPWLVVLIMVEAFANCILYFYNAILSVHYKFKEYLVISFIYSLSSVVFSVVLILFCFRGAEYMGRVLGSVIPLLCLSVYMLWRIFREAKPRMSKEYWKYGLKISLPLIPHQLSQIILSQFDRIMINSMVGDWAAGLYSFAYNIGMLLHVVTNSTDTAWSPWFFEQMESKNYDQIRKSSNLYILLVTVLSAGLMVISPELVLIMGADEYQPSKYVVIPIVMSMFFSFLYTLPVGVEYYYKKTGYIAAGTTASAVVNIVLNYVFIKLTGSYVAAAYTTVLTHFLYYLFHMILARRIAKRQLFNVGIMVGTSAFVLAFGFICLALVEYMLVRAVLLVGIIAVLVLFVVKQKDELLGILKKKSA
ncbi:MAG: oligosaccharide flippase family protein [Clostridia bacterium]|nr:oligosaccharide flippase family protein [Clostridia bacterium]